MSTAANPSLGGISPKTSLIETDLAGRLRHATDESTLVKALLIGGSLAFLSLVLFVPLAAIFAEALRKGVGVYFASFHRSARALGDSADVAGRRDLRAAELGVRSGGRLGDREVSISAARAS